MYNVYMLIRERATIPKLAYLLSMSLTAFLAHDTDVLTLMNMYDVCIVVS